MHIHCPINNIYTVEQAKFVSAIILEKIKLALPSQTYQTRSIGCIVMLSPTEFDGESVGEFQP